LHSHAEVARSHVHRNLGGALYEDAPRELNYYEQACDSILRDIIVSGRISVLFNDTQRVLNWWYMFLLHIVL
jgi:hypothetical protein